MIDGLTRSPGHQAGVTGVLALSLNMTPANEGKPWVRIARILFD